MQLVAYGAQDVYLTGNPQITYFKVVYRRHTNFAVESIEQTFNGTIGFGKKVSATISRNGDLLTDCFVEVVLTKSGATYYPAEEFLSTVELEIGGQRIDKHYAAWFRVYSELFRHSDEKDQYRRMTDFVDAEASGNSKRMYIPLVFFFNKNPGLALPLIALQYHEIKLNFEFASAPVGINTSAAPTVQLYCDYVYLDSDERRRFAQVSHEYLIEQLQFTGDETITISGTSKASQNVRLNLNHPVKYLAFVATNGTHGQFTGNVAGAFQEAYAPLYEARLQLNGHDRFSSRKGSYFNNVVPYQTLKAYPAAGVYLYSFALKPQDHQPSGSCNFSRIDNATLNLTFKQAANTHPVANIGSEDYTVAGATALTNLKVFASSYNVLRVMSGMGGLAFAN